MTGTAAVLYMLLGAALVASGILASALADRIRGVKLVQEAPSARPIRERLAPIRERLAPTVAAIPVVEVEVHPAPAPAKAPRVTRPETKTEDGSADVIAALIEAGYKKSIATDAAWACTAAERATVEGWATSALRRCARGGLS